MKKAIGGLFVFAIILLGANYFVKKNISQPVDQVVRTLQNLNSINPSQNLAQVSSGFTANAQLPQAYVNIPALASGSPTITVANSCAGITGTCLTNLQTAFNTAQPGDIVALKAGDTFRGNFTLPAKTNPSNQWITVQSLNLSSLPASGVRVSPSDAVNMPKIVAIGSGEAMKAAPSASYYRFVGVEVTDGYGAAPSPGVASGTNYGLIWLGNTTNMTSSAILPHHIIIERSYVHGQPATHIKWGVNMSGSDLAVIDCYLSEFHAQGQDSQAINGYNGPGPFKIVNNYLEGAAENIMFGGATPIISGMVPRDIEIRNNYIFKPLRWQIGDTNYDGFHWAVKNLLEIKAGERILIDGNILENSWIDGQTGGAFIIKPSNAGSAPWIVTTNVIVSNNIVKNVVHGFNICGINCDGLATQQLHHVAVVNNLILGMDNNPDCCHGFSMVLHDADDVSIEHNTIMDVGTLLGNTRRGGSLTSDASNGLTNDRLIFRNNLTPYGVYGIIEGSGSLKTMPGAIVQGNGVVGTSNFSQGSLNIRLATYNAVGFINNSGTFSGDYSLASNSPYKNKATDGVDIGVNWPAIASATANVLSGGASSVYVPPTPTPSPSPTPTPTPSPTPSPTPTPTPSPVPTPVPTPSPTPIPVFKAGDINQDGIVNSIDWSLMNAKWFTADVTSDLNKDGIVNSIDFSILNFNWLKP